MCSIDGYEIVLTTRKKKSFFFFFFRITGIVIDCVIEFNTHSTGRGACQCPRGVMSMDGSTSAVLTRISIDSHFNTDLCALVPWIG